MSDWDYRVVRKESEDGSNEWYSVQEIYYDDDKYPVAQSMDLQVEGNTIVVMRTQLEKMLKSLEEPVLDENDLIEDDGEYTSDIEHLEKENKKLKKSQLELVIENGELKDMVLDLGGDYTDV